MAYANMFLGCFVIFSGKTPERRFKNASKRVFIPSGEGVEIGGGHEYSSLLIISTLSPATTGMSIILHGFISLASVTK